MPGVIQGCKELCLAFETREPLGLVGQGFGNFDGDVAIEPGVAGAIDLAHATLADGLQDLVDAKLLTG